MEVSPGLRVVRGPDWDSGDQDGGEGYVGTVADRPVEGRVTVQWDSGERAAYRCGEKGKYDLRVLDTGPTGIVHQLVCSSCGESSSLFGAVWQCVRCYKYYCCTPCYLGNKHSLFHYFRRIDGKDNSQTTAVSPRILSKQVTAMGIFPGAKVIRGHDWKWKNQDGGEGSRGIVLAVTGMKNECSRCVAEVKWPEKKKLSYRMGRRGKVDLKLIPFGAASGGFYCPSHLPVLGAPVEPSEEFDLVAGDRIKVNLDQDVWKLMQESCGEWSDSMAIFIGQTGLVVYADGGRSVLVSYNDSIFYNINVAAVTKVNDPVFKMGDVVRILEDNTEVSRMQKGHGEWNDDMAKCLGQLGIVVGLPPIGDIRVLVQGKKYIFNQACVKHALPGETPPSTTAEEPDSSSRVRMQLMALEQVMSTDLVPLAAAAGDAEMLKRALSKDSTDVNALNGGKTGLHLAANEGFAHIIEILLKHSPDLEVRDNDGDTPLLTAIHMGQVTCTELLVAARADVNARNNSGDFPLYLATIKGQYDILDLLVKAPGINMDSQNKDGNTALHAATFAHRRRSAMILLEGGADPTLYNNRCFNPILSAAKDGFYPGIEQYLAKYPQHVDTRKVDDGHTALMIAAVCNYQDIVYLLASMESCDLDAINEIAGHTALHLASQKGNSRIVETLVGFGANMNKRDTERICPIHRAYLANDITPFDEFTPQIKKVERRLLDFSQKQTIPSNVTLCCFLVCNGAPLEALLALREHVSSELDLTSDMELIQLVAESEEVLRQQDSSCTRYWGSLLRYPADGGPARAWRDSHTSSDNSLSLEDIKKFLANMREDGKGEESEAEMSEDLQRLLANVHLEENAAMVSGSLPEEGISLSDEGPDLSHLQLGDTGVVGQLQLEETEETTPDNNIATASTLTTAAVTEVETPSTAAPAPSTAAAAAEITSTAAVEVPAILTTAATTMAATTTTTAAAATTTVMTTEVSESSSPSLQDKNVQESSTVEVPPSPSNEPDGAELSSSDYPSDSDSDDMTSYLLPVEQEPDPNLCCLCDNPINVQFHPCGCKAMCSECEQGRVKKCPTCTKPVQSRTTF